MFVFFPSQEISLLDLSDAYQSSIAESAPAQRAIDNDTSSCSHTGKKTMRIFTRSGGM